MSEEWLEIDQVAGTLGCSTKTVQAMLRDGFLPGVNRKERWQVKASVVRRLSETMKGLMTNSKDVDEPSHLSDSSEIPKSPYPSVEAGVVEVSVALAGIAAAIAAILPGIPSVPENFRFAIAVLAGCLAAFSAYGALWLLACFCECGESVLGVKEIWALLTSPFQPHKVRPCYWFMGLTLFVWFLMSVLIGILALQRTV